MSYTKPPEKNKDPETKGAKKPKSGANKSSFVLPTVDWNQNRRFLFTIGYRHANTFNMFGKP